MIAVKILQEILADILTKRNLDKLQILLIMFITKRDTQELAEPLGDVVSEPVSVEDGDDVVSIRRKDGISWQWAVGSWLLAVGGWQLAVGGWRLAVETFLFFSSCNGFSIV